MRLFLLFFLVLCFNVDAQEITVLNETTNEPIVGAALYNNTKTKSTVTDFDGKALLDKFDRNELINFQHVSFYSKSVFKSEINTIVYLKPDTQSLDEVVISASKFEQNKRDVPQKITSIKAKQIELANPQTSADLLLSSGQVFIQKSQLGGGSPIIRGFSTNRLLLSVDNVRMNNAIFRTGNVQNVISIDPFTIENTEVILGAGSVVYGSDAVGGVMNFYTKNPKLSYNDTLSFSGNALVRYASASNEKTAHLDFNFGLKKWAFLTSASFTDFDDLTMGSYGPDDYLRPEYVETGNGEDIIVQNDDPRIQRFSGYNQVNFLQKARYQASDNLYFDLGLHYTATSDYPRYDRLIRYRNETLRSAEWNYGPQKWLMANFQVTKLSSTSNLYDKMKLTTAYQNFQESRIDRDFQSTIRSTTEEIVDVVSFNADFEKILSDTSKLFYGIEYVYDIVSSEAEETEIASGLSSPTVTRYPDGSDWQSYAIYTSFKYKPNPKFVLQTGFRYNQVIVNANFDANNEFLNLPFSEANINTGALTGTAGITWFPNKTIQWKANASTAFRAPNIDDVGKVFDSEPGSVVVPNDDLRAEYAIAGDLGLRLNFNDKLTLDIATYYTYLKDALVRKDFTLNGESEIIYNGELSNVQAIQNASEARIYGLEVGALYKFNDALKLNTQYNIVKGTEARDGIDVPVRHVAPSFGTTHFIWENKKLTVDAFADYNGELSFEKLAPSEAVKDYLYALDENGNPYSPSWYTLNLRTRYQLLESLSVTASLENITDQRYRPYSSGISAPGRNLIVALKYTL